MTKLKLGPIADDEQIKVTVELPDGIFGEIELHGYRLVEAAQAHADCGAQDWLESYPHPLRRALRVDATEEAVTARGAGLSLRSGATLQASPQRQNS